MTEAPGRKTDAHLSSVPGGEGRAAKIGEVFTPYVNLKHCIDSAAAFFYNYLLVCIVYDSHNLDTRPRTL